jgi:hypothetical protein
MLPASSNTAASEALMQDFFADMWVNNNKDTLLDRAKLRLLLKETGFIPSAEFHTQ